MVRGLLKGVNDRNGEIVKRVGAGVDVIQKVSAVKRAVSGTGVAGADDEDREEIVVTKKGACRYPSVSSSSDETDIY